MNVNGVKYKTVHYSQFPDIHNAIQLLQEFDGYFDADKQCVCYKNKEV